MSPSLHSIEDSIACERQKLDFWLADTYADRDNKRFHGEIDCSYKDWETIEAIAGIVFDNQQMQQLSRSSIDSLLFFISRNDERGRIIAWLSLKAGGPFSWCGNLSYCDLLFLSEQAIDRNADYCDYQLVNSYRKCESLDDRAISILQQFFGKQDSYTRRVTLHVFQHFALPQTVEFAQELWRIDDCEFAKLSCLEALKAMPNARSQFDTYLQAYKNMYDVNAEDYRRAHIRALSDTDAT